MVVSTPVLNSANDAATTAPGTSFSPVDIPEDNIETPSDQAIGQAIRDQSKDQLSDRAKDKINDESKGKNCP